MSGSGDTSSRASARLCSGLCGHCSDFSDGVLVTAESPDVGSTCDGDLAAIPGDWPVAAGADVLVEDLTSVDATSSTRSAGVPVGDCGVHVVVGVVPVCPRDPDEGQPLRVQRFNAARTEDRVVVHPVGLHAALDQIDVHVDVAAHLDGSAEVDLTVALTEVQVATGEHRSLHEYRVEDAAAAGEVLDVVVTAVLAWRHGPGAVPRDRLGHLAGRRAGQRAIGQWWQREGWDAVRIRGDRASG